MNTCRPLHTLKHCPPIATNAAAPTPAPAPTAMTATAASASSASAAAATSAATALFDDQARHALEAHHADRLLRQRGY